MSKPPLHDPIPIMADKLESKLQRLSIQHDDPQKRPGGAKPKSQETVADSWDMDADLSHSDTDTEDVIHSMKSPLPNAPPPTPASPTSTLPSWESLDSVQFSSRTQNRDSEDRRRPEKSTAVAGRLIAAGLGVKPPRRTDEQKAYDKAVRENEIKRRNKEKEAKDKEREDDKKAQTAMWES